MVIESVLWNKFLSERNGENTTSASYEYVTAILRIASHFPAFIKSDKQLIRLTLARPFRQNTILFPKTLQMLGRYELMLFE